MINKTFSIKMIKKRILHDSFITMLNSCVLSPAKRNIKDVISYWWEVAFPGTELKIGALNAKLIDLIRSALLKKGGIRKPILKETLRIQQIKNFITSTEKDGKNANQKEKKA